MSEFDAMAAELWTEVESTFGDQAIWRSASADTPIVVVVDSDYESIASRGGEALVTLTIQNLSIPERPSPGDIIQISEGRYKGTYEFFSIVIDDGYSVEIAVRKV